MVISKLNTIIITALCCLGSVFAIFTPGGGDLDVVDTGRLNEVTAGNVTAVGGNVTQVNIETNISTNKWQGFYGNVSGGVYLGKGTDVFYNFGSATFASVFVTQGTDIDWGSLEVGSASAVDTSWGFTNAVDVDQAVNVFVSSTGSFAGINSVPNATISGFEIGILDDGATTKTDHVFVGKVVSAGQAGFDGGTYNYQVMVPVDPSTAETYYFYASLE